MTKHRRPQSGLFRGEGVERMKAEAIAKTRQETNPSGPGPGGGAFRSPSAWRIPGR